MLYKLQSILCRNQARRAKRILNSFLWETLQFVHNHLRQYTYARFYAFRKPGVLKKSLEEHTYILKALKAKDKRAAQALIAKHRGSFLQPSAFEEALREYMQTKGGEKREKEREKEKGFD